ncbi:MAG: biopolymer transporter ExbD [Verrucomicrobiota bacterium]|jgi:biopolymer transport protein ExbD|nr:biopolymer transporter ExbD [Verrucomicrobiales bacterium]MBB26978.1 biopolymer transporter ExbD [Verrucomicrobiaceae bacterium]MEC9043625.1 biopolymer transporter ExbD [Verrucomicrobiota bacterium]MBA4717231.1 biopolymer transporter ExbD [Verrucomicrobiales bacterium]MBN77708.1 biopolymer transporter ExbD [Verrucomicrobiaceae bacterium]|tara:strand:- start:792 stop:1214 length:423 start_codon:yes stop_codon:yes gene_type:complete
MKFQSQFGSERTGIQLAPMIDVVFLLLIFFIVLWNYARFETEIDISVPAASAGENPERTIGEIVVNVKKEGGIIIEGIERTELETLEMFKSIVAAYPDQALILRGDKEASFDHIVKVLNLCKEANIWNISFATSQPENTN